MKEVNPLICFEFSFNEELWCDKFSLMGTLPLSFIGREQYSQSGSIAFIGLKLFEARLALFVVFFYARKLYARIKRVQPLTSRYNVPLEFQENIKPRISMLLVDTERSELVLFRFDG